MSLLIKKNFQWSDEETKGYQDTMKPHMTESTCNATAIGPCSIDYDSDVPVSEKFFRCLKGIMSEGSGMIRPMLDRFDFAPSKDHLF